MYQSLHCNTAKKSCQFSGDLYWIVYICEEHPFIAGSPDGIINCSCLPESQNCGVQGRKGCLEVKKPIYQ